MHAGTLVGLASLILLFACQGSTPPSSPQSNPPDLSPPSVPAIVEVEAPQGVVGKSPLSPTLGYRLVQALTVREVYGAKATLLSFRLRVTRHGIEETRLLTSADLIAQTGSDQLSASSSRSMTLRVDFNTLPADQMIGEISYAEAGGLTRLVSFSLVPGIVFPDLVN